MTAAPGHDVVLRSAAHLVANWFRAFNPDQPRDEKGRFGEGGGNSVLHPDAKESDLDRAREHVLALRSDATLPSTTLVVTDPTSKVLLGQTRPEPSDADSGYRHVGGLTNRVADLTQADLNESRHHVDGLMQAMARSVQEEHLLPLEAKAEKVIQRQTTAGDRVADARDGVHEALDAWHDARSSGQDSRAAWDHVCDRYGSLAYAQRGAERAIRDAPAGLASHAGKTLRQARREMKAEETASRPGQAAAISPIMAYSPDQPRDEKGRFVRDGGGGKKPPEPKVEKPRTVKPRTVKPRTVKPKVEKPKVEKPKVEKPKVEKPKVEKPKVVKPPKTPAALTQRPERPPGGFKDQKAMQVHARAMVKAHEADPKVKELTKVRNAAVKEASVARAALAKGSTDPKKTTALMAKASLAEARAHEAQTALMEQSRRSFLSSFRTPADQKPNIHVGNHSDQDHQARAVKVGQAAQYLHEVSTKDALGDQKIAFAHSASGRAGYYRNEGTVRMGTHDDVATALHEWGHHVEENQETRQKAQAFVEKRFGKEAYRDMAEVSPNAGHVPGAEYGRKDEMQKVFGHDESGTRLAYYTGKTYPGGHDGKDFRTEVMAMGLERLHRDPVGLAKADPEYFSLVVGSLQGGKTGSGGKRVGAAALVAVLIEAYNPDQPRDEKGRFGTGGGKSSAGKEEKESQKDPGARPARPEGGFKDEHAAQDHAARMVASHEADPHIQQVKQVRDEHRSQETRSLQAAKDAPDFASAQAHLGKAAQAKEQGDRAQAALEQESRRSFLLSFGTPHAEKPSLGARDVSHYNAAARSMAVRDGFDFVQDISTRDAVGDHQVFTDHAKGGRAHYSGTGGAYGTIRLGKGDGPAIAVHELGHHFEEQGEVRARVQAFSEKRFGSEAYRDMSQADPQAGYRPGEEQGRKDDMAKVFGSESRAYYVGKTYPGGKDGKDVRSEVLSMGMEQLYRDPVGFAKADPEYFSLVVSVLQSRGGKK